MTRIIAGTLGGRRLRVPAGSATRPTADRVREALFASLGDLTGLTVLDLYAGSGAIGLEALSRGASAVTMVEADRNAVAAIRANIATLGVTAAQVVAQPVARFLQRNPAAPFDLVIADPPYSDELAFAASLAPWIGDRLVLERATRGGPPDLPPGIALEKSRRYGETTLWYGARL